MAQVLPSTIPSLNTRCQPSVQLQQCVEPDNAMTQCLRTEAALWGSIALNPTFPLLRIPARYRANANPPFAQMPLDAIRLNVQPTAPLLISAMVPDIFNLVTQYTVPAGMDGVINSLLTRFVPQLGSPLQDGSGMLAWTVQINNYLAYGYANMTVQMGDNATLGVVAHDGGIRISANDLVSVYALVTTAGQGFLDPNGIVLGSFQGWLYPNR